MREVIALAALCVLVVLACLAAVVNVIVRGTLFTFDGLLLTGVCLLLATMFGLCFLWLAWDAGLLDRFKNLKQSETEAPNRPAAKE